MSNEKQNPLGNQEAEGLAPGGVAPDSEQEQENQAPLADPRTKFAATGSGTIKVNG